MINSQTKGKRGDREIAKLLSWWTKVKWRRVPGSGNIHEFNPWDLTPEPNKENALQGFGIEVKNTKSILIPKWVEQAQNSLNFSKTGVLYSMIVYKYRGKWRFDLDEA